ncbi:hypothetical protein PHYBLDRAFT_73626 [Phycomyces blakesleeanus NRRL 1555(-)]|uniref:Uncharacterized protein n=1 Tax=Phycomyces blakesleeanus (strain ATCC 8743b / DSM 1359 / FGSC 10004 / NBRC 33097 / NRRL 1555) TaxID=763407 RepID=A0A167LA23_PHYB8|nr:hypothetical protein PHYBLDRAFT_73626 [Phycomyces blakesleeanus NRRL 1555(-)]OAD69945.1 hypothetical protein PHYBLDRAFT_73626 [Phycomyces blakesleeanus NRRL 1555(-)]|eukprot:XP_018287985.1 hypothetical protein PHYBLDRAFT_73626 [Phycomyces blakesleeanus NRRL 1555(-)]
MMFEFVYEYGRGDIKYDQDAAPWLQKKPDLRCSSRPQTLQLDVPPDHSPKPFPKQLWSYMSRKIFLEYLISKMPSYNSVTMAVQYAAYGTLFPILLPVEGAFSPSTRTRFFSISESVCSIITIYIITLCIWFGGSGLVERQVGLLKYPPTFRTLAVLEKPLTSLFPRVLGRSCIV